MSLSSVVTLFSSVVYVFGKVRSAGAGSVTPRVRVTLVLPRPSPRPSRSRASLSQRSPLPLAVSCTHSDHALSEAARVYTARATLYY